MKTEMYFDNQRDALEQAAKLRASSREADLIVRVEESPYAGYCLKLLPLDIVVESMELNPNFLRRRYGA